MKKTILSIMITIIIISTVLATSVQSAETYLSNYNITLHSYSDKTLHIGAHNNQLYTKTCYYNSLEHEKIYTLDSQIISYCVINGKIYVLYSSSQRNIFIIGLVSGDSINKKFHFFSSNITADSTLEIDKNETFYILNAYLQIEIYNNVGNHLGTTTESYKKLLNLDGTCYGANNNKLQQLSSRGGGKIYTHSSYEHLYKISENYLIDGDKNVLTFSGSKLITVMRISCDTLTSVCETNDYIVSVSGNQLIAYSKNSGQINYRYRAKSNIYQIASYGNLISVIYINYSSENFSADKIFRETKSPSTNQTTSPSKKPEKSSKASEPDPLTNSSQNGNNFTPLDKGNIIIIQQGTTIAQFKDNDKYSNYTVVFKEKTSGTIGTGMSVTISNGKSKKTYTTIVMGDVTGEGNVNSRDIKALFDHLLEIKNLTDAYKIAGDLNNSNHISNIDLVLINRLIY